MDKNINQMVAKNIKLSKIIIEGQRKIRKNPNGYLITIYNQLLQPLPGKDFDLNIRVVKDVGPIIELEGDVKGIRIGNESHPNDQGDRHEMMKWERLFFGLGSTGDLFFFRQFLILFWLSHLGSFSLTLFEFDRLNIPFQSIRFQ
jgi:hypothetical protein